MPNYLPPWTRHGTRVMMFVDGENLAIRYAALLGERQKARHVEFRKDVYVWTRYASRLSDPARYVRRYYYTCTAGDSNEREQCCVALRNAGIDAPRVFPKAKGRRSKRVDIALATDMLTHAHRGSYEVAVLVAGDEDYVPLVEAVQAEGRVVALWFVDSGLSSALRGAVDHYWDMGDMLFNSPETEPAFDAIYLPGT